jgi:hypothetical protein
VDERMNKKRNMSLKKKIEEVRLETLINDPVAHEISTRKRAT